MPAQDGTVPPMIMLRSFLTIASGFVGQWLIVGAVTIGIANFMYPEFMEVVNAKPVDGEALGQADVFAAMPRSMFLTVAGVSWILMVLLGICIGWSAPFGRLVHTIFLAVIVGVSYLSESLGAPQEKKVVMMTYLMIFPMAILLGGHLINRWMSDFDNRESATDDSLLDPTDSSS